MTTNQHGGHRPGSGRPIQSRGRLVRVLISLYPDQREWLAGHGSRIVIPNRKNRKEPYAFDAVTYKRRNVVERTFCRLKDFRRLATRYDRLDETFISTICIAAALAYFLK